VKARAASAIALDSFLASFNPERIRRVPGTAVFMTGDSGAVPHALLHNLKHNKVLHERIVLMNVHTEDIPHVPDERRIEFAHLEHNFHVIKLHYGFMDEPNIPRALAQCRVLHFHFNLMETSFFLRREKIVAKPARFVRWRKQLFILMSNTMLNATEFFRIPSNRVIELGGQIEI
jgi:KUP system potassium uptake protein